MMDLSRSSHLYRLQWNEMRRTGQSLEKVRLITLHLKVTVRSRATMLPVLSDGRLLVLQTAYELSQGGLSSKDIADELNLRGYQPSSVGKFYPKLVWVMLKKYRARIARMEEYVIENIEEKVSFT